MLDNGLGPWRSMFIYNWIKQDLLTYNAPLYLRTECSERKKRRGPNKKKISQFKSGS